MDHKSACVLLVCVRRLFKNFRHAGKPRAALQLLAQLRQLRRRSRGEHLDAAIEKILHIAVKAQIFGHALNEEAVTHSLHDSRNVVAPCLFRFAHKLVNFSRDAPLTAARRRSEILRAFPQLLCGVRSRDLR